MTSLTLVPERSQTALSSLARRLPELLELEELRAEMRDFAEVVVEDEVLFGEHRLPIYSFAFGSTAPDAPRVAFVGGVHGLERIGSNVVVSFLKTMAELVQWDRGLQFLLSRCRVVALPIVNPAGMFARTRANARGVDLMRNAPLDAEVKPNVPLVGGHRLSPPLPWYRGVLGAPMEQESQVLLNFVRRELFCAPFSIALDLHSGFGLVDRLWFPYAYSRKRFEKIDLMLALKARLDSSLPNHFYQMEPQSQQYITHGDLWDYLYLEQQKLHQARTFLPLTLEMGSWLWIKKNPRQLFTALGIYNPIKPHRIQRTLRRHLALLDFLIRAAASFDNWSSSDRGLSDSRVGAAPPWYQSRHLSE